MTLSLELASSVFSLIPKSGEKVVTTKKENSSPCSLKWKLKWFCKENLLNFIALAKAIYLGSKGSSLPVRYVSWLGRLQKKVHRQWFFMFLGSDSIHSFIGSSVLSAFFFFFFLVYDLWITKYSTVYILCTVYNS